MITGSDDEAMDVPIVCPRCETTSRIDLATVADALRRHNERLHDGEEVATIDPAIRDELATIVARDLDLL